MLIVGFSLEKFQLLTECSSSGSFTKISWQTWCQIEAFLICHKWEIVNWHLKTCRIEKTELCVQINNLRDTLFNNQLLFSKHSFEIYASLIPILHCVCSALDVCEVHLLL